MDSGMVGIGVDGNFETFAYNNEYNGFQENYEQLLENSFVSTVSEPVSTFSVDADGASYANMRRFVSNGTLPPPASVRIEEYLNYFTFDYAEPEGGEKVALNSELAQCPWESDHFLLRVGMKGITIPENKLPASNYVFLIDVSGSMDDPSKLGILKSGFKTMTDQLQDEDRVAIVTYAGEAGVLLESTSGAQKDRIKSAIDKLGAGGSTAGADGILTAYEIAEENFIEGGNNRIILGSDGDFNVGPASVDELIELVEEKRDNGIYLTTLGVGSDNYNDAMMEQIANHGNGNFEYIDYAKQLRKVFIEEKGKFYTVAKDSKIQITFNEQEVARYRLIGYENRMLSEEDFENDRVDAGEIGSGQTITALYELIPAETEDSTETESEEKGLDSTLYAEFDFRYKIPGNEESRLLNHRIEGKVLAMDSASSNIQFASAVGAYGMLLRESSHSGNADKAMVLNLARQGSGFDPNGYREEFFSLVEGLNF
jgi:Ca-activated chloride channel family protein